MKTPYCPNCKKQLFYLYYRGLSKNNKSSLKAVDGLFCEGCGEIFKINLQIIGHKVVGK